ncbi:hypothetical protein SSX86_015893 [Deinandra increscens subsp. villosa]|uniref:Uncharacterized protein n=1 Tax=Deinandra increscens subsp. villosa TaxID=3103831 RepID=A0AAP0CWW4_9ASTR
MLLLLVGVHIIIDRLNKDLSIGSPAESVPTAAYCFFDSQTNDRLKALPVVFRQQKLHLPSFFKATPFQKYIYPDPIPEFAAYETNKFREELRKKLCTERETFGDDLDAVLDTCSKLFSEFLHNEYGGPGTLLVEPFTNMLIELKQRKLPGANLAARASLLWAQNYLDRDWEVWNSKSP